MRRGAFSRRGQARRRLRLPLPHVPEGQRHFLPASGFRSAGDADVDARTAEEFESSNVAYRGFCGNCGTPLTYEAPDGMTLAIAAFDHPEEISPTIQWGTEAKLPYVGPAYRSCRERKPWRIRRRRASSRGWFPISIPTTIPKPGLRRTEHERGNGARRRLPMRRGALSHPRRARPALALPLPHVPRSSSARSGAFVNAPGGVERTRETPSWFQSSVNIERGFCARCGMLLFYRNPEDIDIAIGVLMSATISPRPSSSTDKYRLPWVETIFEQPIHEDPSYYTQQEKIISFQHPDHETEGWPTHGMKL